MNNGRKDNRSSRIGRLYHRRLYLLAGQKEKQEVSQSSKGRSKNSAPFQYHKEVRNEPSQKD